MRIAACLLAVGALVFAGCASIIHGSQAAVTLDSSPVGATAVVDGRSTVQTPAVVNLDRKVRHLVLFSEPGYLDQSATIEPAISGWIFGNVVFGPLFGLAGAGVDLWTGAAWSPSQDAITASLARSTAGRVGGIHGPYLPPRRPYGAACWREQSDGVLGACQ